MDNNDVHSIYNAYTGYQPHTKEVLRENVKPYRVEVERDERGKYEVFLIDAFTDRMIDSYYASSIESSTPYDAIQAALIKFDVGKDEVEF